MYTWIDSVYSDSTINFVSNPYPERGENISISIRVRKNPDLKHVILRTKIFGMEQLTEMKVDREVGGLVYYKADVACIDSVISYQFYLVTDREVFYYTQNRITDYIPEESRDFKVMVGVRLPKWVKGAVFYQIFPDRFRNGKDELTVKSGEYSYGGHETIRMDWGDMPLEYEESHCLDFYGGDLYGVIEKLDYLKDLGVNALYLNPIFEAPSMHKYDALDYFKIDDHLGGDEAFAELCREVHKRGMRVILDISINHTSSQAKWFNKDGDFYPKEVGAYNNPESLERSYYFIKEDGTYDTWVGVPTMPKLNYASDDLRDALYRGEDSVLKKWMKAPFKIDGYRFDVADCMARNADIDLYREVWEEINAHLKALNPEALILAEDWSDCSPMFDGLKWDSTMNYFACARPVREFLGQNDLFNERNDILRKLGGSLSSRQLKKRIEGFLSKLPSNFTYQMFNLLDSHDVSRFYNDKRIGFDETVAGMVMMYSLPGAVNIYYGDEIILDGRTDSNEGCRYPMDWSGNHSDDQLEIFELYKKLNVLKKDVDFADSSFKILDSLDDIYLAIRFTQDRAFVFAYNRGSDARYDLDIADYGLTEGHVTAFYGQAQAEIDEGFLKMMLPAKKAFILEVR